MTVVLKHQLSIVVRQTDDFEQLYLYMQKVKSFIRIVYAWIKKFCQTLETLFWKVIG